MSDPASTSLFTRIISDPALLISYLAVGLNILITIANYVWFTRRRKNERQYQLDLTFYQLTVLNSLNGLVSFSSSIKRELSLLMAECRNAPEVNIRGIVEKRIEKVDKLNDDLSTSLIKGYSNDLCNEIDKLKEKFYDKSTEIFSKFANIKVNSNFERKMERLFSDSITEYIETLFKNVKKYCPTM